MVISDELAQQIFAHIEKTSPSAVDSAFLLFDNTIYFATVPQNAGAKHKAPNSAIVRLIQAVYQNHPSQAFYFVRKRIYSTAALTEMCRGMIKVAATRVTAPVQPLDHGLQIEYPLVCLDYTPEAKQSDIRPLDFWKSSKPPQTTGDFLKIATEMAKTVNRDLPRYQCDRPIAALLVSSTGEILSWGLNTNSKNKTLHAEVNLLQSFYRERQKPIPTGARIYVSLKPCRMCAGMIATCAEDIESIQVHYTENDPGPNAQHTALDRPSHQKQILFHGTSSDLL